MILAKPVQTVELDHRAYHRDSGGSFAAAASEHGHVSVATAADGLLCRFDVKEISRLRVLHDDLLTLVTRSGVDLHDPRSGRLVQRIPIPGADGLFTSDGHAWVVREDADGGPRVEIVDTADGRTLATKAFEDPFGQPMISLERGPDPDRVAIWIAGGQDGQCNLLAAWDGSQLGVRRLDDSLSTGAPMFAADGHTYLHVDDFEHVRRRETRTGRVLTEWSLPDEEGSESPLVLLGNGTALGVTSCEEQTFLLRPATLELIDQLQVDGEMDAGTLIGAVGEDGAVSLAVREWSPTRRDALVFWTLPDLTA